MALNLPAGLGEPFFDSLESRLAHVLFSIPAVKGLEFGMGFGFCRSTGSQANDPLYYDGDSVRTETNNNSITAVFWVGLPMACLLYSR